MIRGGIGNGFFNGLAVLILYPLVYHPKIAIPIYIGIITAGSYGISKACNIKKNKIKNGMLDVKIQTKDLNKDGRLETILNHGDKKYLMVPDKNGKIQLYKYKIERQQPMIMTQKKYVGVE